MWWRRKPDPRDALVTVLKDEITVLRLRHDTDTQRMDRLMEAMARRAGIDLVLPQPTPVAIPQVYVPNPWKDANLVTGNFKEKQ